MKVYLVIGHGSFSCSDMGSGDTWIVRVFLSKEKADSYCQGLEADQTYSLTNDQNGIYYEEVYYSVEDYDVEE